MAFDTIVKDQLGALFVAASAYFATRRSQIVTLATHFKIPWREYAEAYDVTAFVEDLRQRRVTPHIAIDGRVSRHGVVRKTAVDGRTARHVGYGISQVCRKRIEVESASQGPRC
jgi:hypothetical protein